MTSYMKTCSEDDVSIANLKLSCDEWISFVDLLHLNKCSQVGYGYMI